MTLRILAEQIGDLDLTPGEVNALANLSGGRGHTVSELGRLVGAPPTTLTSVLDRLERRGHVVRDRHPSDRRAVFVSLTPSGRQAATAIRRAITRLERRAFRDLDGAALDGLRSGLTALSEAR